MEKYKNRKEVPEKYKWDLSDFFKNEKEFETSLKETKKLISKLPSYVGCTKEASKLYEFLNLEIEIISKWENLYVYSYLINDQELGNKDSIKRKSKSIDLCNDLNQNISFFEPELLKLSQEEYQKLFEIEPKLNEYKVDLDKIYRNKEHILPENEEKIINELVNAMDNFDDISSNLLNNEHNYGKIKLNDGTIETIATNNFRSLMKNKDRNIRKKIYVSFNKKLDQYGQTNASLLNAYIKKNNSIAKLHNFNSSWDEKLFNLNVTDQVFKTLVATVEENTKVLQKYYQLKKKILGYDKLFLYDLSVDISNNNKEYTIEEAQKITKEALKPLKEDYLNKFNKIFDNHYIDYCQYKGKCSGGYSFSTITNDSRILMSYNGEFDSVSTIAHEGGHNVHHQYLKENNPLQYRDQSSMVSEVASLTNECLLSNYLAKNGKTKEEKLAGIKNMIEVIISNLFGAVREGKIEEDMYNEVLKGGTLTKDFMDNLVLKSLKKYYGNTISLNKNAKNSWITRSHYFMNFYLYSYSISISVATNIASKIIDGDDEMLKKYLEFLKTGSDKYPLETFAKLGVNLEDKQVYENAIKYFDELINQYEQIYYEKEGETNEE